MVEKTLETRAGSDKTTVPRSEILVHLTYTREYDTTTEREKALKDELALLKGATAPEKRQDLVEAVFVKYRMVQQPGSMPGTLVRQVIPKSPGGYEHNRIYEVPKAWLSYPWWRPVKEEDREREAFLRSKKP